MSASPSPFDPTAIAVPDGHIGLVLIYEEESSFYLRIPLDIISTLCLKPRKFLLFLGWCILGVEGVLSFENNGEKIEIAGDLKDREIYYYVADAGPNLTKAVDLEVIKMRSQVSSETTETFDEFRNNLLERDDRCLWTGVQPKYGDALHIIPHKRGSEWFRLIVQNRPNYEEDVTDLDDIDDIRNGMFAVTSIHSVFNPRDAAILKTPNHILDTADIPPRRGRPAALQTTVAYPTSSRYTLQWLVSPDVTEVLAPHNSDAAFKKQTTKPKPSDLLLHYNYGAAAVKCWGQGLPVLQRRAKPPRPAVPVPSPAGPSKTAHDRSFAIRKRDKARASHGTGAEKAAAGAETGELEETEDQAAWDEDDVMLFFWGNSPAAIERHSKKVQEDTERMEQWRRGVL